MSERWLGVVVSGDKITVIDAEVPDTGPIVVQSDQSWPLQSGDRIEAYVVMAQQVANFATENEIDLAVVKESAVSLGGTKKAHLESAELRGVVLCALGSVTKVELQSKGVISRTFGARKVDEYLSDDAFWKQQCRGAKLRAGSREAAMIVLAARKKK